MVLPKTIFAKLLAKLMKRLHPANLVSGFRAAGICPLDRSQVLKNIPRPAMTDEVENQILSNAVLTTLHQNLGVGVERPKLTARRGRKIVPGQRVVSLESVELLNVPTKRKAQDNPFMPFKIRESDLTVPIIPSEEQGWSSDNSVHQNTMLKYFAHECITD